jgi:hypothetical protein
MPPDFPPSVFGVIVSPEFKDVPTGATPETAAMVRTIDAALAPLGFTRKKLLWSKDIRTAQLAAELRFIGPTHYELYYGGWLNVMEWTKPRHQFGYVDLNMEYEATNFVEDRLRYRLMRALNFGLDWAVRLEIELPFNDAAAPRLAAFKGEPLTDEWRCSVMSELLQREVVPIFQRMEAGGTMRAIKEMIVSVNKMTRSR